MFGTELIRGTEEGLGVWHAIGLRLAGSDLVELIHYPSSPGPPGYIVRVDHDAPVEPALSEILALFGLHRSSLPWVQGGA